eukprot:SAG31_NODE_55_length_29938_cov_9.154027_20_plen_98_part_00
MTGCRHLPIALRAGSADPLGFDAQRAAPRKFAGGNGHRRAKGARRLIDDSTEESRINCMVLVSSYTGADLGIRKTMTAIGREPIVLHRTQPTTLFTK